METRRTIETRRSVRSFTDRPVSREDLETILGAAMLAPSAKNSQPWRFTVIGPDKKDEMLSVIRDAVTARKAAGEDVGTIDGTLRCMTEAPVTVLVHNTDGIHPWLPRKEHESWWDLATVQSVGAAIQNMLLAARDLGIGSLWIADVWEAYGELNQWLGIEYQLVAAVSFGYAAGESTGPRRKPPEELVTWIGS
jgi:nitroreductase